MILPVTELDRANQIFERMLYQEPSRHPERQGPQEAEKAAPKRQERPVQEERQEGTQSFMRLSVEGPCGPAAGAEAKKRFSVGTRLARYKNQLLYTQREREYRDDA